MFLCTLISNLISASVSRNPEDLTLGDYRMDIFTREFRDKFKIGDDRMEPMHDSPAKILLREVFTKVNAYGEKVIGNWETRVKRAISDFCIGIYERPDGVSAYDFETLAPDLKGTLGKKSKELRVRIALIIVGEGIRFKPEFFEKMIIAEPNGVVLEKRNPGVFGTFYDRYVQEIMKGPLFGIGNILYRGFADGLVFVYHRGMDKLFLCTRDAKGEVEPIFRDDEASLAARQKDILIANRILAHKIKSFVNYVIIPTVATAVCYELLVLVTKVTNNEVVYGFLKALQDKNSDIRKRLESIFAYEAEDFTKDYLTEKLKCFPGGSCLDSPSEKFTENLTEILTEPIFNEFDVGDDKRSELRSLLSGCIQESTTGKVENLEDFCGIVSKVLYNGSVRKFLFDLCDIALLNALNMAIKIRNSISLINFEYLRTHMH
jgi:hypothetical protein